jgi:transaldolase
MTRIQELHAAQGQSIWLDSLTRGYFSDGHLQRLIDLGVRGLTSNPTLMAQAITGDTGYDEDIVSLSRSGADPDAIYWALVNADVAQALELFLPLYLSSGGGDGFVSVEVSPELAYDADGTIQAARGLRSQFAAPNVMIKIPATAQGVSAVEETIAAGISVNATLIFTLQRYGEVIDAYERGMERFAARGGDPRSVASVASFFISRFDTEVDRRLEQMVASGSAPADELHALAGHAAVAQARLAFSQFQLHLQSERSRALRARGIAPQRLLWASTSVKNPAYPELQYVDTLVGPATVNTMPETTIRAFERHGATARTVDADPGSTQKVIENLGRFSIDLERVGEGLEGQGVAAFAKSFGDLRSHLLDKAAALSA